MVCSFAVLSQQRFLLSCVTVLCDQGAILCTFDRGRVIWCVIPCVWPMCVKFWVYHCSFTGTPEDLSRRTHTAFTTPTKSVHMAMAPGNPLLTPPGKSLIFSKDSQHSENNRCNVCLKYFASPWHLRRHFVVHTGEKPYKCDICGKSYGLKEHLVVHTRIHTGEKPYKCQVCDKLFSRSDILKTHTRTHMMMERPFKCMYCDECYTSNDTLKYHMVAQHSTPLVSQTHTQFATPSLHWHTNYAKWVNCLGN